MINDFEKYDSCWFEIKTGEKSVVMRDHGKFLRQSQALSHTQEIRLYKIERSVSGLKKTRIHIIK